MDWYTEEQHMTHKTWGGRFKKPLHPLTAQFNASLEFDHILFAQDILGSQTHAAMLARQGLITEEENRAIHNGLEAIKIEMQQGLHPLDPHFEDIHMMVEQLLVQKIGDAGKKLHTGRSRNDQVALDLRLYSRDVGQQTMTLLQTLVDTLESLIKGYGSTWMPGYTHLQQAQPIQLQTYFGAYKAMFIRDHSRLKDWYQRMNVSPLGAGALAGSSLPLDREWVAETLGFDGIIENTIDAVSDRDFVIEFCSTSAIVMMHLSRLCEDLILWATQEFGFISLDDAFSTGSSLMPNKKNPDVLELIRGKSGRIFGHLLALLTVMKGLPMAYNKDMQEDKEALFDTSKTILSCLQMMIVFLPSLHFHTAKMEANAGAGFLDATAILEQLVMSGVPFREAHHQVGAWVAQAMEMGSSLSEFISSQAQTATNAKEIKVNP